MLVKCSPVQVSALILAGFLSIHSSYALGEVTKFARVEVDGRAVYGIVANGSVTEIEGDIFGDWKRTNRSHSLESVKLLVPTTPVHVLAMAGNYRSHLRDAEIPPAFQIPQPFFKSPSSLAADGEEIVIPRNSDGNVHYEAEMVVVIGKKAKDVEEDQAMEYVFGVTCGNDVSERFWQNDENHKDIQWWRAKASDTFGPCGPYIVQGLDYDDLLMQLRLNGEVVQKERTSLLIHDVAKTVSFISQHMTLLPGDLIFTGTPGTTGVIKPGDVVEVELEGVGTLQNTVVKEE